MKNVKNEQGVALVTALLLTLISLAIVMAALYFIGQQTELSAAGKRYRNSLEAAHGGGPQVFAREIMPRILAESTLTLAQLETDYASIGLSMSGVSLACLRQKVTEDTKNWTSCSADNKTSETRVSPDAKFVLKGLPMAPGFVVYSKIVDTQKGNSDTTGFSDYLDAAAGVASSSSIVTPKHIPAVFRIEVRGERQLKANEHAGLTVLYAF
jgi:hypothetical protein